MEKFTERAVNKILKKTTPIKTAPIIHEGRVTHYIKCGSKSRAGVKYNRLVRLSNAISVIN